MGRDQRLPGVVARAVHGVQCGPNVERDPERDAKGQPVAAHRRGMMKIGKADAVQPLGHDEERSAILPDVENLEHVRMRDRGRDPSFVEETARERRIGRWRDDGLEGDWAGDPWLSVGARLPDGDRAGSLELDELVPIETISGSEGARKRIAHGPRLARRSGRSQMAWGSDGGGGATREWRGQGRKCPGHAPGERPRGSRRVGPDHWQANNWRVFDR